MARRWRPSRTAVGSVIAAAAIFAVGTNVQAGWLLALAGLLLGVAAAGCLLPLWAVRGLVVTRRTPAVVTAGDPVTVELMVRNTARGMRGLLLIEDDFLGTGSAYVPLLAPGEERGFTFVRRDTRRGVRTAGLVRIVTGAPFAMARAQRLVDVPSQVLVVPRIHPVDLADAAGNDAHRGRKSHSGEAATVREHRTGEPLRNVHWRSTARRGRLMVRAFESGGPEGLEILADPSGPDVDAVAAQACSYAVAALRAGRRVAIRTGIQSHRPASVEEALEWGARLERGPGVRAAPPAPGWTQVWVP